MLRKKGWIVKVTVGNMFMQGFPDLYATHAEYKSRWIEVKNPLSYSFTKAQKVEFPLLTYNGTNIWVLMAATEAEYKKLFRPPNFEEIFLHYQLKRKGMGK